MRVAGTVSYDPRRPAATVVRVLIHADSIVTHNRARDARLRSHGFLDVRARAVLSRSDFSVGPSSLLEGGGPLIGDEVAVEMDLELARA
jgi:hypothetical protein